MVENRCCIKATPPQRIQDPSISAEAVKRCKAFVADPNNVASLNADIRLAVFDVTVKSEGDAMFDELIKAHDALRKIQKNGSQKTGVGKLIEYSGKRTSQTISFWGVCIMSLFNVIFSQTIYSSFH